MTEPADRLMPFLIAVLIPFLTAGGIPDPDLARIRALTNITSMLGNGEAPAQSPPARQHRPARLNQRPISIAPRDRPTPTRKAPGNDPRADQAIGAYSGIR